MTAPSSLSASPRSSAGRHILSGRYPFWLRSILGMFGLYIVAVIILEFQSMPTGSVQRNAPAEEHNHIDPSVITQITEMEKQVAAEPANGALLLQFANLLHDARFFPRAVETYKKHLAIEPDNHDARVDLGICYYETGDLKAAIREIESVIARAPKHQMAMFNLGVIQLSAQNMTESAKWLKKCIDIDPQSQAGLRAQQILQQHQ